MTADSNSLYYHSPETLNFPDCELFQTISEFNAGIQPRRAQRRGHRKAGRRLERLVMLSLLQIGGKRLLTPIHAQDYCFRAVATTTRS